MKTKRGEFYYIEMTGAFYAGTRPIMKQVEVIQAREWTDKEKKKPLYRRNERQQYGWQPQQPKKKGQKHTSYAWGRVHLQVKKPAEKVTIEVPTAEFIDVWTEDFTKAKKFRIKSKATDKAVELSRGLDRVRAEVKLYEGDR